LTGYRPAIAIFPLYVLKDKPGCSVRDGIQFQVCGTVTRDGQNNPLERASGIATDGL
jgi:hypothetical protein